MTVSKVVCPECETVLKLASQTPGKKIKCPKCGAKFALADEPAPVRKSKKAPAGEAINKDRDKTKKSSPNPTKADKKPTKHSGEDDEGGLTYGFVRETDDENKLAISYAPDTSIKDLRGPAQAAVVVPTNFLLLIGALGFFGWVGLLIMLLIPVCFPTAKDEGTKDSPLKVLDLTEGLGSVGGSGGGPGAGSAAAPIAKEDLEQPWLQFFGLDLSQLANCSTLAVFGVVFAIAVMMGYSGVLIMGAVQAQNLESRQWGIASSIMAMIPLNTGGLITVLVVGFGFGLRIMFDDVNWFVIPVAVIICLAGVGVGVWNLVTFFDDKVIAGYEFVPDY
jgi:DNA-directed RNA polymerase subunit M/transcription elongation factor TFIIS